jgi:hypothetical protein
MVDRIYKPDTGLEEVKFLIDALGDRVNVRWGGAYTPLMNAVEQKRIDKVRVFLASEKVNLHIRTPWKKGSRTALNLAMQSAGFDSEMFNLIDAEIERRVGTAFGEEQYESAEQLWHAERDAYLIAGPRPAGEGTLHLLRGEPGLMPAADARSLELNMDYMRNMVWKKHPVPQPSGTIGQGQTLYDPYTLSREGVSLQMEKVAWERQARVWSELAREFLTLMSRTARPASEVTAWRLCLDTVGRMATALEGLKSESEYDVKLRHARRFLDTVFNPELNTEAVIEVAEKEFDRFKWGLVMRRGWYYYRQLSVADWSSFPGAVSTVAAQSEALSRPRP